jgi:hypothetical protein
MSICTILFIVPVDNGEEGFRIQDSGFRILSWILKPDKHGYNNI